MILVLDTNALWHGELLEVLGVLGTRQGLDGPTAQAVIPSLALAERLRQVWHDEPRRTAVQGAITDSGARIEPFGPEEAERLARRRPTGARWAEHARDHLIASHVHGARVAVTDDRGPAWDERDAVTPEEATEILERLVD